MTLTWCGERVVRNATARPLNGRIGSISFKSLTTTQPNFARVVVAHLQGTSAKPAEYPQQDKNEKHQPSTLGRAPVTSMSIVSAPATEQQDNNNNNQH